jgi:hypothetical protein
MEFPQRVAQHITETASFKIFSNCIPDNWIIREVSERDYGIDCYIELVNVNNQVTGELISIQLKGMQNIPWTKGDYYTFSGVNTSTSNYWYKFPTPVFLCVVDTEKREVFYTAVKTAIRKNFFAYIKQEGFSYKVEKKHKLELSNLKDFILSYFNEKQIFDLEKNITTFMSHYQQYQDFIEANTGRDQFMGVEMNRVLYLKHFYNNLKFLGSYFGIEWPLKALHDYFEISKKRFGDHAEIHEQLIDEVVSELEKLLLPILLALREHITQKEKEYWSLVDQQLFNVMINVRDDGSMPFYWES